MSFKHWVKRLAPPLLTDLYRTFKQRGVSSPYVWEGVYRHYRDVPRSGAGYDSDRLVKDTIAHARTLLAACQEPHTIPTRVTSEHSLLPLLVSVICQGSSGVRVLDFGGGMGAAYVHVVHSVLSCGVVDYHVVDTAVVSQAGARLFGNDRRVHFHDSLPDHVDGLDIVHVSSALQYIEDYAGLLRRLCAYRPRYVLFVKLSSGDMPTYATAQRNLPGTTLPYWLINVHEIIALMSESGYSLIFKGALEKDYNQDNFPAEYRLGRACNLLFSRSKA